MAIRKNCYKNYYTLFDFKVNVLQVIHDNVIRSFILFFANVGGSTVAV